MVAEGDQLVTRAVQAARERPEARHRPVRDAEAGELAAVDLRDERFREMLDRDVRVVPVQHEDVEPIDAEIGEGLVDLCPDERRRAVRWMAALPVEDEVVAHAARREPCTDGPRGLSIRIDVGNVEGAAARLVERSRSWS